MGKVTDKLKDIIGIEGDFKSAITPMCNYTCANITLGGAGYPIGQFHQQYLAYVEGLVIPSRQEEYRLSAVSGMLSTIL